MEYQLGLWDALDAMLVVKGSVLGTMFFLYLYIGIPLSVYMPMRRKAPKILKIIIIIIFIFIFMWGFALITVWGSGWRINDDFLHMKTFVYSSDIKISSMEIGFVTNDSQWKTKYRVIGAGEPGLLSGKCRLDNKKSALVFNHFYQNKLLLITAADKYYLIGHPGIENLYDELIRLGAKQKDFENNEMGK